MAVFEMVQTWNRWVSHPFRRKKRKGWGTEVYSKNKMPQNEDRGHGLLPGSLRAGATAVSEAEQTWNSWVSHPFRLKKRKGWGKEVYSKNKDASEREPGTRTASRIAARGGYGSF